jgi:hypothetical protein
LPNKRELKNLNEETIRKKTSTILPEFGLGIDLVLRQKLYQEFDQVDVLILTEQGHLF